MAKKAKRPAPKKATEPLARLRQNMRELQRDAERVLTRTRKQASNLISRDQQQALDRLVREGRRLRKDIEKRAQKAQKDVEARAQKLLSGVEDQLSKRVEPLLRRLDVASRKEVRALNRRIAQLEKRLRSKPAAPPKAASAPEAQTPPFLE